MCHHSEVSEFSLWFSGLFLLVLFSQLCLMLWLVLHPLPAFFLQLYDISDMVFKVVLVGVAAINFIICFLVEVSDINHQLPSS